MQTSRDDEVTLRSADGNDVVQTETENILKGWGEGFMVDDSVIMLGDYNLSCLDISGHVTAGNSRLVI